MKSPKIFYNYFQLESGLQKCCVLFVFFLRILYRCNESFLDIAENIWIHN